MSIYILLAGYCASVFFDHSKCQFFNFFIAIFSKVGRFASEEVVLNLLRAKCLPVLYCVESCPLLARDKRSLESTVTRAFMKLLQSGSVAVVNDCQNFFSLSSEYLSNRYSYGKIYTGIYCKR